MLPPSFCLLAPVLRKQQARQLALNLASLLLVFGLNQSALKISNPILLLYVTPAFRARGPKVLRLRLEVLLRLRLELLLRLRLEVLL